MFSRNITLRNSIRIRIRKTDFINWYYYQDILKREEQDMEKSSPPAHSEAHDPNMKQFLGRNPNPYTLWTKKTRKSNTVSVSARISVGATNPFELCHDYPLHFSQIVSLLIHVYKNKGRMPLLYNSYEARASFCLY